MRYRVEIVDGMSNLDVARRGGGRSLRRRFVSAILLNSPQPLDKATRVNARPITAQFGYKALLLIVLATSLAHGQSELPPKKLLLSHILIQVSAGDGGQENTDKINQAQRRAEEVLAAARSGKSFARLAEQYSEDPGTAQLGGSLGWIRKGQLTPSLDEAAFQLKVGEISGIVRSAFGFHILRLVAIADDHESAIPVPPRSSESPAAPTAALPEQSQRPVSHWPDPNNPQQMGVGKSIAELRELCDRHAALPFSANANPKSSEYECSLVAIPMDADYERLVDRIARLQNQECRLYNGSMPVRAPADPEQARTWKELVSLTEEWGKRSVAFTNELSRAEAAEVKGQQESHEIRIAATQRVGRLSLDFWRVHSNCGNGL